MTLAKLDKVEGRTIHVSGIDIISETPILDIKPYHYKDAVEEVYHSKLKTPSEHKTEVEFKDSALEELKSIISSNHQLEFYSSVEEVLDLIKEVLRLEPHTLDTSTLISKTKI